MHSDVGTVKKRYNKSKMEQCVINPVHTTYLSALVLDIWPTSKEKRYGGGNYGLVLLVVSTYSSPDTDSSDESE